MKGPERKFKWPCYRRDAHGSHVVTYADIVRHDDSIEAMRLADMMSDVDATFTCPGVKAHPATMIGGAYKEGEY